VQQRTDPFNYLVTTFNVTTVQFPSSDAKLRKLIKYLAVIFKFASSVKGNYFDLTSGVTRLNSSFVGESDFKAFLSSANEPTLKHHSY